MTRAGTSPTNNVSETDIDAIRTDAAVADRGAFVLRLLPLMGVMPYLQAAVRDLPRVDTAPLMDPAFLAFLAAAVVVNAGLSLLSGARTRAALLAVVFGLLAVPAIAVGLAAWNLPPIDWSRVRDGKVELVPLAIILTVMLAILIPALWWLLLSPIGSARRLLAARIGPQRIPYVDLMSGSAWSDTGAGAGTRYAQRTAASTAWLALAIIFGLVATLAVLWLFAQGRGLTALAVEFACLYGVLLMVRRSRQSAALGVDTLLAADTRPPILYLRAFQDDAAMMQGEWDTVVGSRAGSVRGTATAAGSPGSFLAKRSAGLLNTTGRLEEIVAQDVRRIGPFVAIGDPGEPLPQLGAARAYFDNDTWRGAIERWVDMARLIVKVAGPTRWVRWELDTIIDRGGLGKLVLLMPPVGPQDRAQRWQNMMAELATTAWGPALGKVDPAALVALRFREGGGVSLVTGGKARAVDYALAMRIMLAELRTEKGR